MAMTISQIEALTHKWIMPKLVDNVYSTAAGLARMSKGGKMKLVSSGEYLRFPVISSTLGSGSGGYYSGYDLHYTEASDDMTSAQFSWKQVYESIRISGLQMAQNSGKGKEAEINFLIAKYQIAEKSIKDRISNGLFSDGTAATGALSANQITGFQALFSSSHATTSYGGLNSTDLSTWYPTIKSNSGTARALTLNLMQQTIGGCSDGSEKPTVGFCRQNVFDEAWALFQPTQRTEDTESGKLGFSSLMINGIPLLVDSHMPAASIYFVNEEYAFLVVHRDYNLKRTKMENLETSDNMLSKIYFFGNLCCNNRRRHGSLVDITVAS